MVVQGPYYDDLHDPLLAITGGTAAYADARGQMTLHALDAQGTKYRFTYAISR
ncbi:hypothetical protein [Streptomyces hygroscopicus]|uniref:hypothetical protein n=1 Tax=Streptomyces hygroscopicus TaxID=1912 RepID=UPI00223F4637|nr:hypothetical protein [Streptomyces hygroscopicus]